MGLHLHVIRSRDRPVKMFLCGHWCRSRFARFTLQENIADERRRLNQECRARYLHVTCCIQVLTMRRQVAVSYLIATCCCALAACAGSGAGLDSGGRPLGSGATGGPIAATFESIQENVFSPICSICHAGGAAPQGLRLDAVNSYSLLVGVPSTEVASTLRIKPGDPDNSYLVQKIEGHAAIGAQMPFGGPPLPAATIAVIRQWVADGASRAAAASASSSFRVMSIAPATGDVVLEAPTEIVVGLSHELDATRVDDSSLRLERLSATAESGTIIPADLAFPVGNPAAIRVIPRQSLTDGRYRLVIPRAPATGLSNIGGQRLSRGDRDITLADFSVETGT